MQLTLKRDEQLAERTAELVQANAALRAEIAAHRESERRLREQAELIDKANEAIITVGLDHRISFWSAGAERLFGWTAAESAGRDISEVLTLDSPGGDPAASPTSAAPGDWRGEIRARHRDGRLLVLETSVTVLRDEASRPTGRLSISTDITEKKTLEEKFLRAQQLENVGMLAVGIAHDLNNVLTPIGMASTLLRRRLSGSGDLRLISTLEQSARRGADLVRQIVGFMHGISGAPRLVQVKHLLRDITALVVQTFPKSIVLDERIPSDLWPVIGNPTHIHQVLLNLCVNARDAMPDGGVLRLRGENCLLEAAAAGAIEGGRPGAWLVLHVEDTGTGIPPEVLARIWEPFFTTKSADKGTGLGLSTVRGIVETHGGFIDVRTVPGHGTLFRVFLPAAEAGSTRPEVVGEFTPSRGRGERILVIDDEESIRDTACEVLTSAGYEVVTTIDGARAAAVLNAGFEHFDLVITDYDMPGLDGGAVVKIVRTRSPATKVIVISGFVEQADGNHGRKLPMGDLTLAKPFSADSLLQAVQQLLSAETAAD